MVELRIAVELLDDLVPEIILCVERYHSGGQSYDLLVGKLKQLIKDYSIDPMFLPVSDIEKGEHSDH